MDGSITKDGWVTKDSGSRSEYDSGMVRDLVDDKPRFDLLIPPGQPYEELMLTRLAGLASRGAKKYGEENWTLANSDAELRHFRSSANRHFMQWMAGETDEDHAASSIWNVMAYEYLKWKLG